MSTTVQGCVFCEIIRGERLDTEIVSEGDGFMVLVPIKPVTEGHVLFIPTEHIAGFSDSPRIAGRIVTRAGLWASGHDGYEQANIILSQGRAATQTVAHMHAHLVPRAEDDGLTLPWGKLAHEHTPKSQPLSPTTGGTA